MFQFILKRLGQAVVVVFLVTDHHLHPSPVPAGRCRPGLVRTRRKNSSRPSIRNGYDRPIPGSTSPTSTRSRMAISATPTSTTSPSTTCWRPPPAYHLPSLCSPPSSPHHRDPLGVWRAVKRNKAPDYIVTIACLLAYSTPIFFAGLLLIVLFSPGYGRSCPMTPAG